jgi:NAD(P)-dependent dehydrogenase (short-subunit alcohol dehydrogenase family)
VNTSRTVLVTGALTGIGLATAQAFAQNGDSVIIAGRREQTGNEIAAQLRAFGGEVEFVVTDVRREGDIRGLIDGIVGRFGRLDIAVNAAGIEGQSGPITDVTVQAYADAFDTNALGTLLCLKHEMRVMIGQRGGSIVNISSTMGERGAANASLYTASKHAVEGLTKSAALEGAPNNIRVNAVAPGPVQTAMLDRITGSPEAKADYLRNVPLGRAGQPSEIADAIVFLSSSNASFITGQIIRVNGGKTAA